jgi:glycine betaine/proline transport system ATP-binding protein
MSNNEIKVEIKNLYKIFGRNPQKHLEKAQNGMGKSELMEKTAHVMGLCDVNIKIPARGIQVIMGLSGSGKSTLIRHINRLIEPTAGEIIVDGVDVLAMSQDELRDFRRKKASMVFQKFALLPHRTVIQNVAYGLDIQNVPEEEKHQRSMKWLERVGLGGFEDNYPSQLSGGMQQRVGLARALATDADILLMDEAFSALDPLIRTDMQDILLKLQEELHKTIIFITHDLDEALRIGDNIAILRDGSIVQQGTPQEIVLKPADDYVADFIKDINRSRVLQLGSITHDGKAESNIILERSTTIEDAIQSLRKANANDANVIHEGNSIGVVTLNDMLGAIERPDATNTGENAYS